MRLQRGLFIFFVATSFYLGILSKPTKRYRYDADFLDSEIQRIRSGKASEIDPIWTPRPNKSTNDDSNAVNVDSAGVSAESDEVSSESNAVDYYGSSEEVDVTCAPDKGWHYRGQRCVPINCPGGRTERDFNTGECLYAPSSRGRFNKPFQQWNDLNHVYRSNPMSTHFVRSMILMRKG